MLRRWCKRGGATVLKQTWVRAIIWSAVVTFVVAGVGLAYLALRSFTYYDNGRWVYSNLLEVYVKSMRGYGRNPIDERSLGANWGSDAGYAARNFTLDLAGLNYSIPLSWQDTVAGHGLWVMEPPTPSRWKEAALYPTGITILPGERVQVKVEVVGDDGFVMTEQGPTFTRSHPITLYRPRFSAVAYVVEVGEAGPGTIAANITDAEGAKNTVRKSLEAERDNNYEAWVSTFVKEQQDFYTRETREFGIISLTVGEIRVAVERTCSIREGYPGSDLANRRGWSDEHIAKNMVAVSVQYTVDYDNTKVPFIEGVQSGHVLLVRDNEASPWLICDWGH